MQSMAMAGMAIDMAMGGGPAPPRIIIACGTPGGGPLDLPPLKPNDGKDDRAGDL